MSQLRANLEMLLLFKLYALSSSSMCSRSLCINQVFYRP